MVPCVRGGQGRGGHQQRFDVSFTAARTGANRRPQLNTSPIYDMGMQLFSPPRVTAIFLQSRSLLSVPASCGLHPTRLDILQYNLEPLYECETTAK